MNKITIDVPDSTIKVPINSSVVIKADLEQTVEVGDHYLYICSVQQAYGDEAQEETRYGILPTLIGVRNMTPAIWNNFLPQINTMPSVNQVEFNPYYQ